MFDFYVYSNSDQAYSKVHRAACEHCNDGWGKTRARFGTGDLWIAAIDRKDAIGKAKALHRKNWSLCEVCHP